MQDASAFTLDGQHAYHKVSWPSEGVLLLEFNRWVRDIA